MTEPTLKWRENIHKTLKHFNYEWENDIPSVIVDAIDAAYIAGLEHSKNKADEEDVTIDQSGDIAPVRKVSNKATIGGVRENWKERFLDLPINIGDLSKEVDWPKKSSEIAQDFIQSELDAAREEALQTAERMLPVRDEKIRQQERQRSEENAKVFGHEMKQAGIKYEHERIIGKLKGMKKDENFDMEKYHSEAAWVIGFNQALDQAIKEIEEL